MGRLGWTETEAMAANVVSIQLAMEAVEEADYQLRATILRAAGFKVTEPEREKPPIKDRILDMVRRNNAAWRQVKGRSPGQPTKTR